MLQSDLEVALVATKWFGALPHYGLLWLLRGCYIFRDPYYGQLWGRDQNLLMNEWNPFHSMEYIHSTWIPYGIRGDSKVLSTSTIWHHYLASQSWIIMLWSCKGNPLCFRLPPVFRFRSCHLISLPQRLRSHDIVRHPLPTRFPSDPPSAYDTLTRHVCCTLHVFTNFGLISYIHYFVY